MHEHVDLLGQMVCCVRLPQKALQRTIGLMAPAMLPVLAEVECEDGDRNGEPERRRGERSTMRPVQLEPEPGDAVVDGCPGDSASGEVLQVAPDEAAPGHAPARLERVQ